MCAECAARKLFLGSFEYSGQPHNSSELRTAPLPLLPHNFCITFRTAIFKLCLFYFVWAVHFYFHGIILYFYCGSSKQFFIKFRFSTGPEIKCYLFVALWPCCCCFTICANFCAHKSDSQHPSHSPQFQSEAVTRTRDPKKPKKIKDLRTFPMGRPFFLCTLPRGGHNVFVCVNYA